MKKRLVIAGLILAAGMGAASLYYTMASANNAGMTGNKSLALTAVLKGFEPGAKITYGVFPEQGLAASGTAIVGPQGALTLPAYNLANAGGRLLSYDIRAEEKGAPVHVTLTFDAATGKIAAGGKNLGAFAGVNFKGSARETLANADWAGIVKIPDAGKLDDLGREDGFKVALASSILNDAQKQNQAANSKIIQVLAAPGGGLIGDTPNIYDHPYGCNDGISPGPDYSFCRNEMDDQIDSIVDNYVTALIMMTEQLTAVMGAQMGQVGAMLDAKQQLEAQLTHQRLRAEAHKDYQPGGLMCEFGSFVKSIASAEEKSQHDKQAFNSIMHDFYAGLEGVSTSEGYASEVASRLMKFRTVYCDPRDNNDGLNYICDHDLVGAGTAKGATDAARINKDIDYTKTMEGPLTLDIDFAYAHSPGADTRGPTPDEEDALALAKNLYWPTALTEVQRKEVADDYADYMDSRSMRATIGVAHNSYATLTGMKAKTVPVEGDNGGWNYMKSMMRDFGLSDDDISQMLGEYPSYYAQMEVLTKKIYQRPDFYTDLYDKPANVKRIKAAMTAIEIMQQRDAFDSALRREMLTSLMVEQALGKHVDRISGGTGGDIKDMN